MILRSLKSLWSREVLQKWILLCGIIFSQCASHWAVAQSIPWEEYNELHKTKVQSIHSDAFRELRESTNNMIRGYLLVKAIGSRLLSEIDPLVGRLDILYTDHLAPIESDVCTGTSFGIFLLTAAHCIPGENVGVADRFKFTTHYYSDGQTLDDRAEFVLTPGSYRADREIDSVLIFLSQNVDGVRTPMRYRAPILRESIILVSHPLGQGKRLSVGECRVTGFNPVAPERFTHSCATLGGSSGALLFAKTDKAIIGMHVRANVASGTAYNILSIVQKFPELTRVMELAEQPHKIDDTGWPLTANEFVRQLESSLRSPNGVAILAAMLSDSSVRMPLPNGESLYRIAVRSGSLIALDFLRSRGVRLPQRDREKAVWDAIEAIDKSAAGRAIL
jgi:hypothetical protein